MFDSSFISVLIAMILLIFSLSTRIDGYWNMLGGQKRGVVAGLIRQMLKAPFRFLFGDYESVEPGTLILVRHGESLWNANKTFTGGVSKLFDFCLCLPYAFFWLSVIYMT